MPTETYEMILQLITAFTLILQIYVVYLVETQSSRNMNEYRYFLKMFLFWESLFTIILGLFLQPLPIYPFIAANIRGLVRFFGPNACMFMICGAIYAGANVIMCQGYCLLYRFSVIHENPECHWLFMANRTKAVYLIFSQCVSMYMAIFYYNTFVTVEDLPAFIEPYRDIIQQQMPLDNLETIVFVDTSSSVIKNFLFLMIFMSFLAEIVALTLICLILLMLRRNSKKYSKNTYKLHVQFTLLLLAQLMTPILLIIGPVTGFAIHFFLDRLPCTFVIEIGVVLITLYGPTNSIFVLLFVGPYRRHFIENVIFSWLRPLFELIGFGNILPKQIRLFARRQSSLTPTANDYLRRQSRVFSTIIRPM